MRVRIIGICLVGGLCFLLGNCTRPGYRTIEESHVQLPPDAQRDKQAVAGNFSNQVELKFDSGAVHQFLVRYPKFASYAADINQFYKKREFAYAWYDQKGLIEQAGSLFNRIVHIHDDGITAELSYEQDFVHMMEDSDSLLHKEPRNADAELMLTSQYFSFAKHVWQGVGQTDEEKMDWYLVRKKLDLEALMDSLLLHPERSIDADEPVYRQYALLRKYLKKYNHIDSVGKWVTVPSSDRRLSVGDSSETILQIRKRLALTGDFAGDTVSRTYTNELADAVKRFQDSRGLQADGVIGPSVISELNISSSKIVEQIVLNMERARWVPVSMDGSYIVVNIPAFKLYVYDHDSVVWDMNIVAGQPMHETVIFNGELKYIVFSPYWNVPQSIYKNEILPGIKKDPNYLVKHNMEQNGNSVRQKPGPSNSLGRVKFLFPNSYNIYLHDTPSKSLFNKDDRAFSHGCIRLAEPKKLAMYLLRDNKTWTSPKIDAAMKSNSEKWVTLDKPVPVFIAYFTAWVGRDGVLNLRKDVYKRDTRLAEMIIAGN
ncbi:MAG: L,D-transpeptidase family protein [Chryseolinea sp.]